MLVDNVTNVDGFWELAGPLGECLNLPTASEETGLFEIGTVGTRRLTKVTGPVTKRFAERLSELGRPIYLIDIRRNGCGGSGSWGPLELATTVPRLIAQSADVPYSYFHLPCASPTVELLDKWRKADKQPVKLDSSAIRLAEETLLGRKGDVTPVAYQHWQVFRAAYLSELSDAAVLAGRAFVESAAIKGGIALFLCAEPFCPNFDSEMSQQEQDKFYCHRFTFVHRVARNLAGSRPNIDVRRLDLAIENSDTSVQELTHSVASSNGVDR